MSGGGLWARLYHARQSARGSSAMDNEIASGKEMTGKSRKKQKYKRSFSTASHTQKTSVCFRVPKNALPLQRAL